MGKIKVTQVKSSIKRPQNQKRTLEALPGGSLIASAMEMVSGWLLRSM